MNQINILKEENSRLRKELAGIKLDTISPKIESTVEILKRNNINGGWIDACIINNSGVEVYFGYFDNGTNQGQYLGYDRLQSKIKNRLLQYIQKRKKRDGK